MANCGKLNSTRSDLSRPSATLPHSASSSWPRGTPGEGIYELNLIDTPGHVDFGYEVSRSLAACEGAILVVDATRGIQAQTVANVYKALENGLQIIPFINKIDLSFSKADEVQADLVQTFGFKKEEILSGSAKEGLGIEELL